MGAIRIGEDPSAPAAGCDGQVRRPHPRLEVFQAALLRIIRLRPADESILAARARAVVHAQGAAGRPGPAGQRPAAASGRIG
jgi:hypothetical protein